MADPPGPLPVQPGAPDRDAVPAYAGFLFDDG